MRQCENIFVFIDLTKSIGSDLGGQCPPGPPPPKLCLCACGWGRCVLYIMWHSKVWVFSLVFYKCIKLIKSDSKDIMLQKISLSNKFCSLELSISQKILKMYHTFIFKYESAQLFSALIIIRNVSWAANQNIKWFLKIMWHWRLE